MTRVVRRTLFAGVCAAISLFAMGSALATGPVSHNLEVEYNRILKYPKPDYSKGNKAEIKRGEYLVKMGDCISCHTSIKPGAKAFAGGLGIKTPFGTFYTPNITSDKETGIGKWTDAEFVKALQQGVAPGGKHLFPVFPYLYYSNVTKKDILAIRAYLNAIPAVDQQKPKNDVPFPFSWRFLQVGWRVLFFDFRHHGYKFDPTKSKEWNRGYYLVNGLAHCGMCHTPINKLGAPKNDYFLTGNFIGGYYAPNISGAALKTYSINEIADAISGGKMLGGGEIAGPMKEAYHDSFEFLTRTDAIAIATYLKTVKSEQPKGAGAPAKGVKGAAAGKAVYESKCDVCHATGAAGAPKFGNATDWAPRIKEGLPKLYEHAIKGFNAMPAKGTCATCSDQQIKDAVDYMVDHSKPGEGNAVEKKGPAPEKTTLKRGKKVYNTSCAACHDNGLMGAPKIGDKVVWEPLIKKGMPVLFEHTIKGYGKMPKHGGCKTCNDGDIISAVKYMVHESKTSGDYTLW